jgi:hypothetical protein
VRVLDAEQPFAAALLVLADLVECGMEEVAQLGASMSRVPPSMTANLAAT